MLAACLRLLADRRSCCGTRTCRPSRSRGSPAPSSRRSSASWPGCSSCGERWVARRAAAIVVITGLVRRRAPDVGDRREGHGDPQLGAARRDRPHVRATTTGRSSTASPSSPDAALLRHPRAQARPRAAGRARRRGARRRRTRSASSWSTRDRPSRVLRAAADRLDVPLTLLPFQPYDRPARGARSGDVLVVLLEQDGRRVLGAVQDAVLPVRRPPGARTDAAENLARRSSRGRTAACCRPPRPSLAGAAAWAASCSRDAARRAELGAGGAGAGRAGVRPGRVRRRSSRRSWPRSQACPR